jgi:hypothetical protein
MKPEKKARKIVYKHLDTIYNSSKQIANKWDKNTIPLSMFGTLIDKSKIKTDEKSLKDFQQTFNNCLDKLLSTCQLIAKRMNSKDVPISEIKNGINIIKTAYNG